ncbi:MAG: hypothetical protein KIS92_16520 [Planctomycetota bacterium]|nr:hypothetical protein [Planctomycetota bacterium]
MLLLETRDARRLQERWAGGPLCAAWKSEGAQLWWKEHRAAQMQDAERATLDALAAVFAAADGPAAFAFASPELVDDRAPAPPAAILCDQPAGARELLVERVRALRDRLAGAGKVHERPGPDAWKIEETDASQLGFKDRAFLLTFETKVFQALFRHQQSPPQASMAPRAAAARERLPDADLTLHLSRNGLGELAAAGFVFEEEQVKAFDAWGFAKDSTLDGAIKLVPDGFVERHRLSLTRREGLLAVLADLPPPAPAAADVVGVEGLPEAIDLLPPQASVWISLRGDLSARGEEAAKALAGLDPKIAERIQTLEKLSGAKLFDLLAQAQAPVEIGLVFKRVGEELPSAPPVEIIAGLVLKNAKPVAEAFEKLSETTEAFIGKEDRNGGTFYFVKDNPAKPGWWLRGSLLCFASWSQGLDLALAALDHGAGTERMTDRPDVRRALAQHPIPARKTLFVYADAAQALEMPYQVARLSMGSDEPKNRWPAFHTFAAAFGRILIEYGPAERPADEPANPAGPVTAELDAETPLSLLGLLQAFRLPFEEAGW